jgi:hypothetical protein
MFRNIIFVAYHHHKFLDLIRLDIERIFFIVKYFNIIDKTRDCNTSVLYPDRMEDDSQLLAENLEQFTYILSVF